MTQTNVTVLAEAGQSLSTKLNCSITPPSNGGYDDVIRPDIEWIPSLQTYKDRIERLKALNTPRPISLPYGWPTKIEHPRVWSGSDFADSSKYVVQLTNADIVEIERALMHFTGLGVNPDPENISIDTFPLPTLRSKLDVISKEIHDGIGFAVLRGLNPKKYSQLDNILLYLGVTSYIGETRGCQDYDGRMIVHIQDIRTDVRDYAKRGPFSPYTSRAQPFHTDRADILSLYAYDVSSTGGESLLASNAKIFNQIAEKRPDVIHTLAEDEWVFDEFHEGNYHKRPLLHNFSSHGPGFVYSRRPLTGAYFSPHYPGVPAMTEAQAEALDMVHFTAEENALELRLQVGDIELINNFALFHARRGFIDDPSASRHMIRLWLRNEKYAWDAPEVIAKSCSEIFDVSSGIRSEPIYDIYWSPPLSRGTFKRMECN